MMHEVSAAKTDSPVVRRGGEDELTPALARYPCPGAVAIGFQERPQLPRLIRAAAQL